MKITKIETNIGRQLFFHIDTITYKELIHIPESQVIQIYPNISYQEILGFGGAFTESCGYALNLVDKYTYNKIIDEYFSLKGLNYSLCRLPIGSCDFALSSYSYSYEKDLSDFSIERDKKYIVNTIKSAQIRNPNIEFLATPWSPPAFMKSNKSLYNGGSLLSHYQELWAKYLVRYIKEYEKENVNINYMTIQNEPNAIQSWESCIYSAKQEAEFLKNYLFPIFKKNNIHTKFLIWDHNKEALWQRAFETLITNESLNYVAGIAFHWYSGSHFENVGLVKRNFPDKLLIHTEGCTGYSEFEQEDELFNAEMYATEIIGDLNSGANGFIDWNLVLDYKGGPNHKQNYCNSPIMINKTQNGYIKTPSFYYIGHFSKYIKPGAVRTANSSFNENILISSFKNLDGSIVVILLNKNQYAIEYNLCYNNYVFHDNLDSHCIVTLLINGE